MFTHVLIFKVHVHTNLTCLLCLLDTREIVVTDEEFNVYFCLLVECVFVRVELRSCSQ